MQLYSQVFGFSWSAVLASPQVFGNLEPAVQVTVHLYSQLFGFLWSAVLASPQVFGNLEPAVCTCILNCLDFCGLLF